MTHEELMKWDDLVMKIAIKYCAEGHTVMDSWQYAEGWIGLIRAGMSWVPEKSSFMTYAYSCIKHQILRAYKFNSRQRRNVQPLSLADVPQPYYIPKEPVPNYLPLIEDEELRQVTELYYFEGISLRKIGRLYNLSQESIRLMLNRAISMVRRKINVK
jgi:RNA polymerase sigma factor (sigma-70 family)